ncbi:cytochrome P450 [Trichoderma chlorosporum]
MSNLIIVQGVVVLVVFFIYRLFFRKESEFLPLPPGPKPIPILGNIRDAPSPDVPEFEHWLSYKDKYGPIISITVLGQTSVMIFNKAACIELLEKSSLKTASRPQMNFLNMCGYDRWLSLMPYNNQHRLYRKLIHQQIGTKRLSTQYVDIQDVESKRLLLRVLVDPQHLFRHIRTEAAAIILKLTHGYSTELFKPDPLVELKQQILNNTSAAMIPFHWAVDILPVFAHLPEWFPGTSFKRLAREWKGLMNTAADITYNFAKEQMGKDSYQPSYTSKLISAFEKDGRELDEETAEAIKWTASVLFAGGAETTVATLMAFVLGMVLNPEVQQKAQEEIDRVVGLDRLPDISDEENLPYVRGVAKEALRFFPVLPMGIPHEAGEEIAFRGYRIPKGAFIRPCVWWFMNDPKTHANPSSYDPERYLEPRNEPDPMDGFGYGRRICPGRYFAQESLFFTVSRTLAVFNIGKAMHEGKPVDFEPKHSTTGQMDHPEEFLYSIVPRSEKHAEMIRRVEIDHPWGGSSGETIQGNTIFDKFKADCEARSRNY